MFHWYGFFIGLAIVAGYTIAEKIEPKVNGAAPWVIIFGIVGARAWYVVDNWTYYDQNWSDIVRIWEGGMSIWGALIAGALVTVTYFKGSSLKVIDAVVSGLPLAQAIGRLGNAVNGEFTQRVWILPWWGVEAILDLVLFSILWGPTLRGSSSQVRVGVYLVGYGLIRLVLQPYRL